MNLSSKIRRVGDAQGTASIVWWCPGCLDFHQVPVERLTPGLQWEYNMNAEQPTLYPSVAVTWTRMLGTPQEQNDLRNLVMSGKLPAMPSEEVFCHCFVTCGSIHYLPDSTHHLSGKVVDMPDLPTAGD